MVSVEDPEDYRVSRTWVGHRDMLIGEGRTLDELQVNGRWIRSDNPVEAER